MKPSQKTKRHRWRVSPETQVELERTWRSSGHKSWDAFFREAIDRYERPAPKHTPIPGKGCVDWKPVMEKLDAVFGEESKIMARFNQKISDYEALNASLVSARQMIVHFKALMVVALAIEPHQESEETSQPDSWRSEFLNKVRGGNF